MVIISGRKPEFRKIIRRESPVFVYYFRDRTKNPAIFLYPSMERTVGMGTEVDVFLDLVKMLQIRLINWLNRQNKNNSVIMHRLKRKNNKVLLMMDKILWTNRHKCVIICNGNNAVLREI